MDARFIASEDGFDLVAAGRVWLRHRNGSPAIAQLGGQADIAMVRGNFRIEDHPVPWPDLTVLRVAADRVEFASGAAQQVAAVVSLDPAPAGFSITASSMDPSCNRLRVALTACPREHIWGGGEQMSYLRLNGRRFPIWTSEPGVGRDKSRELTRIMDEQGMAGGDFWTTNYPQPTFLSSALYACHLDSRAWSALDFTDQDSHVIEVWEGRARLEFTVAASLPDLVSALSQRFGRPAPLPDWALSGAIVGLKQGAHSFTRLDHIRSAGTAIAGLWCEDWVGVRETSFGRRLFWDWRWSAARYPDLPDQIAQLRAEGIRFLGYVNPYLAIDGQQFGEAAKLGLLALKQTSDDPYVVDFGEFDCGIVDFTNPAAAEWFADRVIGREMLDFGLAGWMADFGEYLPTDVRLHDGSDPMLAHNHWPVLWAQVNARAIAQRGLADEATFFMRAGFSGVQAHCPLLWAGDQCVDFSRHDGIGTTITAALSAGLVGNACSHSDVGGYTSLHGNIRTPELLMRWAELAAFTPVMRTHEGNRPDDNLQIDSTPEILAHFAAMSRVHAALAPYLRQLVALAAETGLPLQRPLFLHYPDQVEFANLQNQYLLGEYCLVAPIVESGAHSRTIMIPQDTQWRHIWSGAIYEGGEHQIAAPFGSPPVFALVGSPFDQLSTALVAARGRIIP